MIRSIMLLSFLFISGINAQNTPPSEPNGTMDPSQEMEQAMKEMSQFFDTLNLQEIFGNGDMKELYKGFGIEEENIKGIEGLMDSLGMSEMFGEGFSKLFEGDGFPGADQMDIEQLDKMMEQGMELFKDIDISQMQKMLEGIDMSEMMKMFEGLDMEQFQDLMPVPPSEAPSEGQEKKKLKKI